jgi:hypothetical protein
MYQHQMYVHPLGDDSNDGFSWDTAKKTVIAAYDDIPSGDIFIGNHMNRDGRIVAPTVHPDAAAGIWITEDRDVIDRDPHWRWPKPVRFIGSGPVRAQFGNPAAAIEVRNRVPSIWLWSTAESTYFENLALARPIWIGIAPNFYGKIGREHGQVWGNVQCRVEYEPTGGGRFSKRFFGSVALARFIRIYELHEVHPSDPIRESDADVFEPSLVIGNAFWLWFSHCRFLSNARATNDMYDGLENLLHGQFKPGDDERAVILIRPDSRQTELSDPGPPAPPDLVDGHHHQPNSSSGLLFFEDLITSGGHMVFYGSHNGGTLSVRDAVFESDNALNIGSPLLIRGQVVDGNLIRDARIELRNCHGADIPAQPGGIPQPDVWVQAGALAHQIVVDGSYLVRGPSTVIGSAGHWEGSTTPETQAQGGFWAGNRIAGIHDAARRIFPMAALPVKNLLNPSPVWHRGLLIPGEYSHRESVTVLTTGIKGPDGADRAFRIRRDTSEREDWCAIVFVRTAPLRAGTRMIAAGWVRPSPYESSPPHISLSFNVHGSELPLTWSGMGRVPRLFGHSNRWTYLVFGGTLVGEDVIHTGDLVLQLNPPFRRPEPYDREPTYCDFCDLFFARIEPGEMTDEEFAEVVQHLVSVPGNVEPGTLTTLANQSVNFQGPVIHQSHVAYSGPPATCRALAAGGVGASARIRGNDSCGSVFLKTATAPRAGEVARVDFQTNFFAVPVVSISPANQQAAAAPVYATATVSGFSIFAARPLLARQEYIWNYQVPGFDKP